MRHRTPAPPPRPATPAPPRLRPARPYRPARPAKPTPSPQADKGRPTPGRPGTRISIEPPTGRVRNR